MAATAFHLLSSNQTQVAKNTSNHMITGSYISGLHPYVQLIGKINNVLSHVTLLVQPWIFINVTNIRCMHICMC